MIPASIVIPTRARLSYLEVALASIAPQAAEAGAEVLVIDDAGASPAGRELTERYAARYEPHAAPLGLNVARNTGVSRSRGELGGVVDDDIPASAGWLQALLVAAREHPDVDVLAGRIVPRLEGRAPRSCGRERAPITSLERVGPFDVSLAHGGDEQEWQDRLIAGSGGSERVLYIAAASVEHRRTGADARLRALTRTAYVRGAAARRFDAWRDAAPSLAREALTLAGCLGHVVRRRCPAGLTMAAHSAGRLHEALRERRAPGHPHGASNGRIAPSEDFLSGMSGTVGGIDALLRGVRDEALDVRELLGGGRLRLPPPARARPPPAR